MLSQYRKANSTIVISIAIFLILDIAVLLTNVWLSHQISRDAIGINLAGRQRMLSQQMSKSVLLLSRPLGTFDSDALRGELRHAYHLFDDTLRAFQHGGAVTDTRGMSIWIAPLRVSKSDKTLSNAMSIWMVWRPRFERVIGSDWQQFPEQLAMLESFAQEDNLQLLVLMNELTTLLERQAHKSAEHIRMFQMIAMLMALINFIVILVQLFRQLWHGQRNQDFLNDIINKVDSSVLVHRKNGDILSCNKPACTMFGIRHEQMLNRRLDEILLCRGEELIGIKQDRSEFFAEIHSVDLDAINNILITTVHDVTEQRAIRNTLQDIAYHDGLTHLPNRLLIFDRLRQEIIRARRYNQQFAVCFIDLDGFKRVNDQYGHDVGDKLLQRVTQCLQQCIRESDTLGRLGGDEFVMILSNIRHSSSACELARNVIEMIGCIREIDGSNIHVGASIGIAIYPEHGTTLEELIQKSDQAMYQAKRSGKNSLRLSEQPDQIVEVVLKDS